MGRGRSGGGSIILVEFPGLVGQVLFFTRNIKSHPKVSIEDQFTKNEEIYFTILRFDGKIYIFKNDMMQFLNIGSALLKQSRILKYDNEK